MPKRLLKRYMPDHHTIRHHKNLRMFGEYLHDPNLWHLNRRSAAGAMAAGIFIAFLPLPGQMVIAAAAAIILRINLPLSVLMVWITNPLTMTPVFYFTYKVGTWLLGRTPRPFAFELSLEWLFENTRAILAPLWLGSVIVGLIAAMLTYAIIRLLWRCYVVRKRRAKASSVETSSHKLS